MEKRAYSPAHRICAGTLAIGGVFWGMLLLSTLFISPIGFVLNAAYLPGWIVFFGWWYITLGNSVDISTRLFWIFSALINTVYFVIYLQPWSSFPSAIQVIDPKGIWWLFVILISSICATLRPAQSQSVSDVNGN